MTSRKKLANQANAIHEAGHTVSMWTEPLLLGVKRVTIVPDPDGASLGATTPRYKRWMKSLTSHQVVRARIRFFLAGRIAEELCLGEPFVGASDDLENATGLAMLIAAQEGMHDGVGMVCLGKMAESEHAKKIVDKAVTAILDECYREEKKRLARLKQDIMKVAFALMEQKTIKRRGLRKLLGKRPPWRLPMKELKRRPKRTNARRK